MEFEFMDFYWKNERRGIGHMDIWIVKREQTKEEGYGIWINRYYKTNRRKMKGIGNIWIQRGIDTTCK